MCSTSQSHSVLNTTDEPAAVYSVILDPAVAERVLERGDQVFTEVRYGSTAIELHSASPIHVRDEDLR